MENFVICAVKNPPLLFYLPVGSLDVFSFLYSHDVIYGSTLPSRR